MMEGSIFQSTQEFNPALDHLEKKRPSIMDQGEIYNQRRLEREALRMATSDINQNIKPQIWYD